MTHQGYISPIKWRVEGPIKNFVIRRTFRHCFHSLDQLIDLLFAITRALLQRVKRFLLAPFPELPRNIVARWRHEQPSAQNQTFERYQTF